jgi:presenilin-like A22 family membrane protease
MTLDTSDRRTAGVRRGFIALYFLMAGSLVLAIATRRPPVFRLGLANDGYWRGVIIAAAGVSAACLIAAKVRSRAVWETVFTATLFLGVWYALLLLLPVGWALLIASLLTLLQAFAERVWSHDLFYLFGPVGLALSLASWLPPEAVLAGLVGLAVYDMVAGPPRRPILDLVQGLVKQGIVPGLIVPGSGTEFWATVPDVIKRPDTALLGAGDLAVPLIVVAQAAFHGLLSGLCVLSGLVLGAWLLGQNPGLAPRPALPILVLGAGLPFCILYIFGLI